MDPQALIGPSNPLGLPAPVWFLVLFKVLGFTLHMAPMNLWYVGPFLAMGMHRWGGDHPRRLSARLMSQMPIIVASGVNFGIVPLLFTQVAYYKVFYPATILMAWPWLGILALLMPAYYGIYLYAGGLKEGGARMMPLRRAAGWVSAVLFLCMGFLFAHGFSLMANVESWPALWQASHVGGAPTGTVLNTADPTVWPRWLMVIGLALTTTAVYFIVDTALFAGRESEAYRTWARRFAFRLHTAGIVWFAATGSWYVFGTWKPGLRALMFSGPYLPLTVMTALGPGLPWLLILAQRRGGRGGTRGLAIWTGCAQFLVLGLNAASRQVVQNAKLAAFLNLTAEPVNTQWSPLILFLILLAAGAAVVVWMIRKVLTASPQAASSGG